MQVVVLCGGKATRLGALAESRPKYLVPVLDRPFCDWQIELLTKQGFERFTFCIAHLGDQIRAHVEYHHHDLDAQFVTDEGRGEWLAWRQARIRDRHAVIYGDSYLPLDAEFVRSMYDREDEVRLIYGGEDYGMRFVPGAKVTHFTVPERWHEVGTPEGIKELEEFLCA